MAMESRHFVIHDMLGLVGPAAIYRGMFKGDGQTYLFKWAGGQGYIPHYGELANNDVRVAKKGSGRFAPVFRQTVDEQDGVAIMFDNSDLQPWHDFKRNLGEDKTLPHLINLVKTVALMHEQGIINLNLHPGGFWCERNTGRCWILDHRFAIAADRREILSKDLWLKGIHVAYAAPEITGKLPLPADERSDIYALGALLFQMVTGRMPFEGTDPLAQIYAHANERPEEPSVWNGDILPELSSIIMRCMEKSPERRFQKARHLMEALQGLNPSIPVEVGLKNTSVNRTTVRFPAVENQVVHEQAYQAIMAYLQPWQRGTEHGLLLRGPAGSGKTELVKACLQGLGPGVRFLWGKYDQMQLGCKGGGIRDALDSFMAKFLHMPEEEQIRLRRSLVPLDDIGQDLLTIAPGFHRIWGAGPTRVERTQRESDERKREALVRFFQALMLDSQRVCLVLDDIQWADDRERLLIQDIMKHDGMRDISVILVQRTVAQGESGGISMDGLEVVDIGHVDAAAVRKLLQSSVTMAPEEVDALAAYTTMITDGNILYVRRLWDQLYAQKQLWLDVASSTWRWVLAKAPPSQNHSLESMLAGLCGDTPALTRRMLEVISCYGRSMSVEMLKGILRKNRSGVEEILQAAVDKGLVTYDGESVVFFHDKIQQAIFQQQSEQDRRCTHHLIAEGLIRLYGSTRRSPHILVAADQVNEAIRCCESSFGSERVIQLNSEAAAAARGFNAYDQSLHYSEKALAAAAGMPTALDRDRMLQLLLGKGRALYLTGDFNRAQSAAEQCLALATTAEELQQAFALAKDVAVTTHEDVSSLVARGLQILQTLGVIPKDFSPHLQQEIAGELDREIEGVLAQRDLSRLSHPLIRRDDSDEGEPILRLLMDLAEAAYYDEQFSLMSLMTSLSARQALSQAPAPESAFAFAAYASLMVERGHFELARIFGELALTIADAAEESLYYPRVINVVCNFSYHHFHSFRTCSELYERSATAGRRFGDHLFGLWAAYFHGWTQLLAGDSLEEVMVTARRWQPFVIQTRDRKMILSHRLFMQHVDQLQGIPVSDNGPGRIDIGHAWQELEQGGFIQGVIWSATLAAQEACLRGDYRSAYALTSRWRPRLIREQVMFPHTEFLFWHGLGLAQMLRDDSRAVSRQGLDELTDLVDSFATWAAHGPDNFKVPHLLLLAQKLHLEGDYWRSLKILHQAMQLAMSTDNLRHRAMTSIFYVRFCQEHDLGIDQHLSQQSLRSAVAAWGAYGLLPDKIDADESLNHAVGRSRDDNVDSKVVGAEISLALQTVQSFTSLDQIERVACDIVHKIGVATRSDQAMLVMQNHDGSILHACRYEAGNACATLPIPQVADLLPLAAMQYLTPPDGLVIVDDVERWEHNLCRFHFSGRGVRSCAWLFLADEYMRATLVLENKRLTGTFDNQSYWNLWRLVVKQLAVACDTVQLYDDFREEIERHRRTARDLELSEFRFRRSLYHAGIGTWDWDIVSGGLYWSESIGPLFGYDEGVLETSYQNFINAVHPDDRAKVEAEIAKCVAGGDYYVEHRVVWPDGSVKWVEEAGDVLRSEDGTPLRMLGVVRDITDRKRGEIERIHLNAQLQQAQKMEAVGQLTAGVAHEFNNILAIINVVTSKIRRRLHLKTADEQGDMRSTAVAPDVSVEIDHIEQASQRARDLIVKMLTFGRAKPSDLAPMSLNHAVSEGFRMLRSVLPSSIEMEFHEDDLYSVMGDANQIEQMLMNLAINSRDAMKGKGHFTVRILEPRDMRDLCASCHTHFAGRFVPLVVEDNGPGVTTSEMDRIFEPFYTTKEAGQGSGLGLSMIDGMMHNHQGHILTQGSAPGAGLRVTLLFPILENEIASAPVLGLERLVASQAKGHGASGHILLVDDEPVLLEVMAEELVDAGIQVTPCVASDEALSVFRQDPNRFQLVILDQTMPRMTGLELATHIRRVRPDIPIFLFSGLVEILSDQEVRQAGITRSFAKPIDIENVIVEAKKYFSLP